VREIDSYSLKIFPSIIAKPIRSHITVLVYFFFECKWWQNWCYGWTIAFNENRSQYTTTGTDIMILRLICESLRRQQQLMNTSWMSHTKWTKSNWFTNVIHSTLSHLDRSTRPHRRTEAYMSRSKTHCSL